MLGVPDILLSHTALTPLQSSWQGSTQSASTAQPQRRGWLIETPPGSLSNHSIMGSGSQGWEFIGHFENFLQE